MSRVLYVLTLVLTLAVSAAAQVTGPPHVFVANTVASPDEVNLNFSTIYDAALNRTGGTMTGALAGTSATFSSTLGVTGAVTLGSTLGVTGATTLAALSATTGTFSSTLAVTGATTLSAALGGTSATFSGTVTGNLFSGSGASLTSIPETAITDGALLARVAANETISGIYTFTAGPTVLTTDPAIQINNTTATADHRAWYLRAVGDQFRFTICNDATTTCADPWTVSRSGATATGMTVAAPLTASSTFGVTGATTLSSTLGVTGTTTLAAMSTTGATLSGAVHETATQNETTADGANTITLNSTTRILRVSTGGTGTDDSISTVNGGASGRKLRVCTVNTAGGGQLTYSFATADSGSIIPSAGCYNFWYDGTSSVWRRDY